MAIILSIFDITNFAFIAIIYDKHECEIAVHPVVTTVLHEAVFSIIVVYITVDERCLSLHFEDPEVFINTISKLRVVGQFIDIDVPVLSVVSLNVGGHVSSQKVLNFFILSTGRLGGQFFPVLIAHEERIPVPNLLAATVINGSKLRE